MSTDAVLAREELDAIVNKVNLYLSVQRFDAAEKLIRAAISDHGHLANMYNLLGLVFHKQSRFIEALDEFRRASQINPTYVEASLNLAATLCDLSRYEEAREIFNNVQSQTNPTKRQPDLVLGRLANLHAAAGKLYQQSNMPADAIREYRKALSLFGRMPDVRLSLARLCMQIGQLDKAQTELEELVRLHPEVAEARTWLGVVYLKLGRSDSARDQWLKVQQTDPNELISRAYLKLAGLRPRGSSSAPQVVAEK